jgi:uridylate kinase
MHHQFRTFSGETCDVTGKQVDCFNMDARRMNGLVLRTPLNRVTKSAAVKIASGSEKAEIDGANENIVIAGAGQLAAGGGRGCACEASGAITIPGEEPHPPA